MLSAAFQRDQFQARIDFQKANPKNIPISARLKFSLRFSKLLKGNSKAADLVACSEARVSRI
eukprot:3897607-Ditylum_brightwellii.AAC.1